MHNISPTEEASALLLYILSLGRFRVPQIVLGQIFPSFGRNLNCAPSIDTKLFVGHGVGKRKVDNHITALRPIDRSGHRIRGCQLKRVNAPNNFQKVAPGTGRVCHHEGNGVVGLQHEDTTDRQGHAFGVLVGVIQDSELCGSVTSGIAKKRELDLATRHDFNVFDPFLVRGGIVTTKPAEFDTAFSELLREVGSATEFGGAD